MNRSWSSSSGNTQRNTRSPNKAADTYVEPAAGSTPVTASVSPEINKMPIPTKEKTKGKQRIMRELEPWLQAQGFAKLPGFMYHRSFADGTTLVVILNVPTFDSRYRVFTRVEYLDGRKPIYGPESFPYECRNHPGAKRYNMHFHLDEETHLRCALNLKEWISEVLLPWFEAQPTMPWRNPNIVKG